MVPGLLFPEPLVVQKYSEFVLPSKRHYSDYPVTKINAVALYTILPHTHAKQTNYIKHTDEDQLERTILEVKSI